MVKKASEFEKESVFSAEDFSDIGKDRLRQKQIEELGKQIRELPDGAAMPDWSHLAMADRLAIVAELIPGAWLDRVMGVKAKYALPRYRTGTDIPVKAVAALAAETEIPIDWIVTGRAQERLAPLVRISPESPTADAADIPIRKLAFKAAAGRGELILDDLADHIRFPRAILTHSGVAPLNARLMEASGESMRSTINDGDLLLIDISPAAAQIVEGKIYVFSIGNEAYVKRLRRIGDQVLMISDNRDMFPEEVVPEHLPMRVYGRVKWAGRNL